MSEPPKPRMPWTTWVKIAVGAIFILYAVVFLSVNSRRSVDVWLIWSVEPNVNLLVLLLAVGLVGAGAALVARWAWTRARRDRARNNRSD